MPKIIEASEQQKAHIITHHGLGKFVILPYYDGCNEDIEDYLENYEMHLNSKKLRKELEESVASGDSNLII